MIMRSDSQSKPFSSLKVGNMILDLKSSDMSQKIFAEVVKINMDEGLIVVDRDDPRKFQFDEQGTGWAYFPGQK